ncbi:MAG TPA: glycosyltransferase family 9 protein [Gammaproteobacteria bacterium]|nr:glycosyltransferase family 9 protein [Gammaproteobacteria bacterium]
MASPLIKAVRRRYPDAHIAWLVQPEVQDLLSANADLDEVIVWPRSQWRQLWQQRRWLLLFREIRAFRRRLREHRFDVAVDVQGLLKSGMLVWLSGAPDRVGLGSKEGSAYLMTRVIPKPENDPRIGSEYLHIARELGWDSEQFEMEIAVDAEDERFAWEFIEREQLTGGYVVFAPFTTRPQKHWVDVYWSELAREFSRSQGLPAVVLGGPGDIAASARLVESVDTPIFDLAGRTTLRQSAAITARAKLVVGVDTGLTHMGVAAKVPTIALFGSTCPYLDTGNARARVIYKHFPCSPCRRNPVCEGEYGCMRTISVKEVVAVTAELLQ